MKRILATATVLGLLSACSEPAPPEPIQETTSETTTETTEPETEDPAEVTDEPTESETSDAAEPTDDSSAGDEPPATDPSTWTSEAKESDDFPNLTAGLIPTAQRFGDHEGYERIVIDFEPGEGHTDGDQPQFHARYDAAPIYEGRGNEVDLGGETYLWVTFAGTQVPWEDIDGYLIDQQGAPGSSFITGVETTGAWEGMSDVYIGLDKERPFTVTFMPDPDRFVIDIAK